MASDRLEVESLAATDADKRILRCSGPLILSTLFALQDKISAESSRHVILDLTNVSYIDSAGLGALIRAHVSLKRDGRTLSLAGVSEKARALLEMTDAVKIFPIYPTAADAK